MIQKLKKKLNGDLHLNDLLKGSATTFVLKIGGMALSYLLIYLISRHTGAEGVGFYQLFVQVLTVLGMLLALGLNTSVLRFVGQFNNPENQSKMHLLYRYFVSMVAPLTIGVGLILYLGADSIVRWTGKEAEYAAGLKVVGLVLPFFTINQISVEFIRGLKQLHISELIRSVLRPLVMIAGIACYFSDSLTKLDIIYLLAVGLIINSLVSRWAIWNTMRKIPRKVVDFDRKELMRTSYPMLVTGLAASLLVAMPVFFLDYYSTQAEVGVYSLAFRLASLVSIVLVVVNTIAAPKFAELFWAGKMVELQRVITQSASLMFWVACAFSIGLIAGGTYFLGLFGEEFTSGYWMLVVLTVGQLVNAATGSVGILMNMSGMQGELRKVISIITLLCLVCCALLLPLSSNKSMLVALLITFFNASMNVYLAIRVYRRFQLKTYYTPFS